MNCLALKCAASFIVLTLATSAFAEQANPQAPESGLATPEASHTSRDNSLHALSFTFSPVHLASPILELTAEYKALPQLGLAVVGGFGSTSVTSEATNNSHAFSVWEIGAQARYYALGSFSHGLQLGIETLYTNISDDEIQDGPVLITAEGSSFSLGAFAGYKIASKLGFTFEGQLGVQAGFFTAEARHDPTSTSAEEKDTKIAPLLNLNIGWSF